MSSTRLSISFVVALLLCTCAPPPPENDGNASTRSRTDARPNIIYILADDLGYGDLSSYGQTHFSTPNIDRLAAQGMRFTSHYSGSTVCAPSRSALMTGLHTGHTPVRGNKEVKPEGQWPLPDTTLTLAEMMREAGYATGAFGKWGLGYPGSEGEPLSQGFDEFYGYNCQRLAHHYYPETVWHDRDTVHLPGNEGAGRGTYAPDTIQAHALRFVTEHQDEPFFLYYPHVIPHAEMFVPEEYMERFRGEFLPEENYAGKDSGPGLKQGAYGSQPEAHAAFAGMVTYLDEQVGELLDTLEALGLAENTLVIFTSDNGPHLEGGADPEYFDSNGPYRGFKRDLYEGGIRVPMLARWPGRIAAGSESDHPSAFWDMVPTLAEVAGFSAPEYTDGISFLPTLTGEGEQENHDYLYWEFHEKGGRVALRRGDWKLVRYNVNEDPDGPYELYDLATDPGEDNDVADAHPGVVDELSGLLENARTESPVFRFAR